MARSIFRMPSIKKSLSAKFSVKRKIKNAFGLKIPKGFGIFTNPKKAIYNKIYHKTSINIFKFFKKLFLGL